MSSPEGSDPTLFDREFYLAEYPEVARSGLDAEIHFDRRGWREGKDPSPFFSTEFYLETHPDIRAARINPFEHYVRHGRAEGRAIGPSRALRGALSARIGALLDAEPAMPEPSRDPAALLIDSRFFSARHYAAASGATGDRAALVAHYLATPEDGRISPHPWFDPGFYRETYGADGDPLLDWLGDGRARGRYPNALSAMRDAGLIRTRSGFDSRLAERTRQGPARFDDPATDYVLSGQERGALPVQGFDAGFVRRVYMARRDAGGTAFAYYLRNIARPWIYPEPVALCPDYEAVSASALFDPGFYAAMAGIDPSAVDPVLHFLLRGVPAGLPTSEGFHTGHYLARNPDLAQARINPLVHFDRHGRAEGRSAVPDRTWPAPARLVRPGKAPVQTPDRPRTRSCRSAIVVSHEASMTGAPIVALNVARALAGTHEVISWLGRGGPLEEAFAEVSAEIVTGLPPADDAGALIGDLASRHDIGVAVVNSALSGAALSPLRRAGVPTLLLVHDFATYVWPRGLLTRLVLSADLAVFPAAVVAEAQAAEQEEIGAGGPPGNVRIAHQGWNGATAPGVAPHSAEALRRAIGAGPGVKVMLGAGWVQPRKGVDLFVQTAALLARGDGDWRFVWVGGNFRPAEDMLVSVYLADQVARSGLTGKMFFFDEQPDLEAFWEVADIFLLSSRLDPYPNVALDALMRDVPVICFQGATGIAELAFAFGFAVRAVPFCDTAEAAAAAAALTADPGALSRAFRAARPALEEELSFETYVGRLSGFAGEAAARQTRQARLADRLGSRPLPELEAAAACLPAAIRPAAPEGREALVHGLSALALSGAAPAGIAAAWEAAGPLELLPAPAPGLVHCRPRAAAPGPDDWAVHVHLSKGADPARLPDPGRLSGVARVVVTSASGDPAVDALPWPAETLSPRFLDPMEALGAVLGMVRCGWVTHLDAGTLTEPRLARLLLDPALVGAAIAEAAARDGAASDARVAPIAVALPEGFPDFRPRAAEEAHGATGGAPVPRPIAPAFAGLYATGPLRAYLRDAPAIPAALRGALGPAGAAALHALRFSAHAAADGAATLILPDPDAGIHEPDPAPPNRGLPDTPPEPPGAEMLAPLDLALRRPAARPEPSVLSRLRRLLARGAERPQKRGLTMRLWWRRSK